MRLSGQIRPAKLFYPAREDMKKQYIYKHFLIW